MTALKLMFVAVLLVVLSQSVTAEASTTSEVTTEPSQTTLMPTVSAKIQVGDRDNQIRFWRTNKPRERQATIYGLSALILIGTAATWARRRFY
ncbi:hypothetical protein [Secundilactobacillus folii]|uniref:LPXTG cell wall anchor domain-containing protein n=1 Tax=Secundilactobacillus folii TaxID=2678357 RepID=A0A7X2XWI0_9LACO|nr:hypothetical protein [Secundilactobacillus folii]MTV82213.1 hypothetical protein [Secundilactobacillus folii]